MQPAGRSPLRVAVGLAAACGIAALACLVLPHGELTCPAVVDASHTFSLSFIAPGQYQWALRDSRPPGSQALVSQRVLEFERADLVELRLEPQVVTGARVASGQTVAALRSLHNREQLAAFEAQRSALAARRALLVAGGTSAEVQAAERQVAVAEAEQAADRAGLERMRLLAERGLVSAVDLEVAQLQDEVHRHQVAAATAGVEVARRAAQPEALADLDAQLDALAATIAELERLRGEEAVVCPIDGVVELGGIESELEVHTLDPVYLDLPVPAAYRPRLREGGQVFFTAADAPDSVFVGTLVAVATSAATLQGRPVMWASAELANPDLVLRRGMTGSALIPLDGGQLGLFARARLGLWRTLR